MFLSESITAFVLLFILQNIHTVYTTDIYAMHSGGSTTQKQGTTLKQGLGEPHSKCMLKNHQSIRLSV